MRVLIADGDQDLADWLAFLFRKEGHAVTTAGEAQAALSRFHIESPDLVLLEWARCQGFEVLEKIRRESDVPVLILTDSNAEDTLVTALESGADDCLVKPFRPRELRARVRAVVRRTEWRRRAAKPALGILVWGDLALDQRSRHVTVAAKPIQLTPLEYGVLEYLMYNQRHVVRVQNLLENVWRYGSEASEHAVRMTIRRLRQKIEPQPSRPTYVHNVPGQGYILGNM